MRRRLSSMLSGNMRRSEHTRNFIVAKEFVANLQIDYVRLLSLYLSLVRVRRAVGQFWTKTVSFWWHSKIFRVKRRFLKAKGSRKLLFGVLKLNLLFAYYYKDLHLYSLRQRHITIITHLTLKKDQRIQNKST